jgi:hypothetical protein
MTLILTIANKNGVHQCSDYQLTDPRTGNPVADTAGTKQLKAGFRGLDIALACTGIARISTRNTIDWLAEELKALPPNSTLQDICEALQRRCSSEVKKLGPSGVLTIVLTVSEIGAPYRIATISNAHWGRRPPTAKTNFEIQVHTVAKPFRLISGYREVVPQRDRQRLKALAKASSKETIEIQDALAEINATAAKNSKGWISENCWIESQFLDGQTVRFQARNIGQQEGSIREIVEGIDLSDLMKNFRVAPGKKFVSFRSPVRLEGREA